MKNDVFALAVKAVEQILTTKAAKQPDLIALESKISEDLGLSSLDLAELVALLEEQLNVSPFDDDYSITDVVTLDDLCKAYAETQRKISFAQSTPNIHKLQLK